MFMNNGYLVENLKRYLKKNYFFVKTPSLVNWQAVCIASEGHVTLSLSPSLIVYNDSVVSLNKYCWCSRVYID